MVRQKQKVEALEGAAGQVVGASGNHAFIMAEWCGMTDLDVERGLERG